MNELTEIEKAYLAGFLDGEGCIYIARAKPRPGGVSDNYSLRLSISQRDGNLLKLLRKIVGIGQVYPRNYKKKERGQWYSFAISGHEARELLAALHPYLIAKQAQASVAIKFMETYDGNNYGRGHRVPDEIIEKRQGFFELIKNLKNNGIDSGPR